MQRIVLQSLTGFIAAFRSQRDAQELLVDLFTPTEMRMIGKRIAIAALMLEGVSYRTICSELKVSSSLISSVSNALKRGGGAYEKLFDRIKNSKEFNDVLTAMLAYIVKVEDLPPAPPGDRRRSSRA